MPEISENYGMEEISLEAPNVVTQKASPYHDVVMNTQIKNSNHKITI